MHQHARNVLINCYINFGNSPCREIIDGIVVFDENNNPVGKSKKAAAKGITQVVISRVTMAAPGMSEFIYVVIIFILTKLLSAVRRGPVGGPGWVGGSVRASG